jgi:uncharacterized coiled-coil protein SlyX
MTILSKAVLIMAKDIRVQITRLETLYTEQEYTIQALNQITVGHDHEISQLRSELELLIRQYRDLKENLPPQVAGDEKPPHY